MANEFAVAPPDNAANAVQNAIATGDITALKAIAPRVNGTMLAPVANEAISNMDKAISPASKLINSVNSKGGIASPEGRLDLIKQYSEQYKNHQPTTGLLQGIAQGLMGNKQWSNAMTTGNEITANIAGKDGRAYRAVYNQNSNTPTMVFDENDQPIPYSEFMKMGGGLYKNITDTPGYISGKISTEEFTKANNEEQAALNNAVGLFGNVINPRNEQNMQALLQLKKANKDLPNAILDEIAAKTSLRGSSGNTASTNYSNIAQANDVTSLNNALDKAKEGGMDLKLGKVVGIDAKGNIKTSDGESTTKNDLLSKVKGGSNSNTVEQGWTSAREQIVKGELYKRLDINQKALVDMIMNNQQAIDMAKTAYINKHGWPSVLSPSAPYQPGQTLNSNIANTFIDSANLEHATQAKANLDNLLSKGLPIVPGSAAAQYSQSREAQLVNSKYGSFMEQALRLPVQAQPEAQVLQAPQAFKNNPSAQNSFTAKQNDRLASTEKLDTSRVNEAGKKVDNRTVMSNVLKKFLEQKEGKK